MSSMLEQAIVDAEALKEAAIKNAEAAIIEKYSADIKSAVNSLLEAEEDELGLDEAPEDELGGLGGDMGAEAAPDSLPDVPPAATDGENLCPCPDEQEEIVVDFDALAAAADAEMGMDPAAPGAAEDPLAGDAGLDAELGLDADEDEEELELTENLIDTVVAELLKVDHEPVPSGTVGGHAANPAEQESESDAALAKARDTEAAKEEKEQAKAVKDLQEKLDKVTKRSDKAMKIIAHLETKLNETNLLNAKLLYTNKILNSDSLNERQKNQVAEAISRAGTVEEAKVMFETLQSAVQSSRSKRQPKSLSEVVSKRTSAFMPRRTEKLQETRSPEMDRWAILAGIKNRD